MTKKEIREMKQKIHDQMCIDCFEKFGTYGNLPNDNNKYDEYINFIYSRIPIFNLYTYDL